MSSTKKRRELARAQTARVSAELQRGSAEVKATIWKAGCHKMQEEIDRLKFMLQMAYCQKTGADTPDGLDCCDDYRDWLATLTPNA